MNLVVYWRGKKQAEVALSGRSAFVIGSDEEVDRLLEESESAIPPEAPPDDAGERRL